MLQVVLLRHEEDAEQDIPIIVNLATCSYILPHSSGDGCVIVYPNGDTIPIRQNIIAEYAMFLQQQAQQQVIRQTGLTIPR